MMDHFHRRAAALRFPADIAEELLQLFMGISTEPDSIGKRTEIRVVIGDGAGNVGLHKVM